MQLEGIHHITAITGDAPRNVDFYTRVLGLRLVAKTVNQDDPTVYHLFYADEDGTPGSDMSQGGPGGSGGTSGGGGILPGGSGIEGHVTAGPTCPVVRPDDPACADRPLEGVTIVVLTAAGNEAGRTTTDASGYYGITLPSGPYTIEPQPVQGMVHGSPPVPAVVGEGVTTVDIPYDTGIR